MGTYITKLSNIDSTAIADVGLPFYNERLVKTTTSVLESESLSSVSHTLKKINTTMALPSARLATSGGVLLVMKPRQRTMSLHCSDLA